MHTSLLTLAVAVTIAAPVPKGAKTQPPSLDGTWEVVELTVDGIGCLRPNQPAWKIDRESVTAVRLEPGGKETEVTGTSMALVRADADHPGWVDYRQKGKGRAVVFRGVAEVDGDELRLSLGQADGSRPEKEGSGVYRYKFRRVKAETKSDQRTSDCLSAAARRAYPHLYEDKK